LKKKIRQIDELQAKIKSGELKDLTTEQKEKIGRREELLKELKEMEEN
jgi:partner of Y14 and mago protein